MTLSERLDEILKRCEAADFSQEHEPSLDCLDLRCHTDLPLVALALKTAWAALEQTKYVVISDECEECGHPIHIEYRAKLMQDALAEIEALLGGEK